MSEQLDHRVCGLVSRGMSLREAQEQIHGKQEAASLPAKENPYAAENGWEQHPESPTHLFKGAEVFNPTELAAKADEWDAANAESK